MATGLKMGGTEKVCPQCGTGRQAVTESVLSGQAAGFSNKNKGITLGRGILHCFFCSLSCHQTPLIADGANKEAHLDNLQSETLEVQS